MLGKYKLTLPTLGMIATDHEGHRSITVPIGKVIDLNGKTFNGERLMEVLVDGVKVLMFTADLKAQAIPVAA